MKDRIVIDFSCQVFLHLSTVVLFVGQWTFKTFSLLQNFWLWVLSLFRVWFTSFEVRMKNEDNDETRVKWCKSSFFLLLLINCLDLEFLTSFLTSWYLLYPKIDDSTGSKPVPPVENDPQVKVNPSLDQIAFSFYSGLFAYGGWYVHHVLSFCVNVDLSNGVMYTKSLCLSSRNYINVVTEELKNPYK